MPSQQKNRAIPTRISPIHQIKGGGQNKQRKK